MHVLLASTSDNFGFCATYDPQGNLYSGGISFQPGYPVINAFDSTFNGTAQSSIAYGTVNVVITKYDSSGTFYIIQHT